MQTQARKLEQSSVSDTRNMVYCNCFASFAAVLKLHKIPHLCLSSHSIQTKSNVFGLIVIRQAPLLIIVHEV